MSVFEKSQIWAAVWVEHTVMPAGFWTPTLCVMGSVLWFDYSPAISKRLEKRIMDFVALLRSDQNPKSGPVSSPLRLKADRPKPRKYGGASKIWRYLHIVGRMTAERSPPERGWRRMSEERKGGRCVNDKPCLPTAKIYFKLHQMPHPLRCELAAKMSGRFCSNEIIISCFQVHKAVIMNLPYSMPLRINISPMVRKVRFLFWWLSIGPSGWLPFINRPLPACVVQKCCSVA